MPSVQLFSDKISIYKKFFLKISKKDLTLHYIYDILIKSLEVTYKDGSIAQLGEHLPYKQRVTGSSPVVPTIQLAR